LLRSPPLLGFLDLLGYVKLVEKPPRHGRGRNFGSPHLLQPRILPQMLEIIGALPPNAFSTKKLSTIVASS
jgi:hypothetical protein